PSGEGRPPTIRRRGSPAAWASMVLTVWIIARTGWDFAESRSTDYTDSTDCVSGLCSSHGDRGGAQRAPGRTEELVEMSGMGRRAAVHFRGLLRPAGAGLRPALAIHHLGIGVIGVICGFIPP